MDLTTRFTAGRPDNALDMFAQAPQVVAALDNKTVAYLNLTSSPQNSIKTVLVADNAMQDITDGIYEYSIEIEALDRSYEALQDIVTRLDSALDAFKHYEFVFTGAGRKNFNLDAYLLTNWSSELELRWWRSSGRRYDCE